MPAIVDITHKICLHGLSDGGIQASPLDCLDCNHAAIARYMRWWITYDDGSTGRDGKHPGMSWNPDHHRPPTPEDRARLHAKLDEWGWPR